MRELKSHLPPGVALRKVVLMDLTSLSAEIERVNDGQGVHAARRKIKLFRSLLRLMSLQIGKREFRLADAELRQLARTFAEARKEEAMAEVCSKLVAAGHVRREDIERLLPKGAQRKAPTSRTLAGAQAILVAIRRRVLSWRLPKADTSLYAEAAGETYRRAKRRLRIALRSGVVGDLHQARKSVIHHLHHIQMHSGLASKEVCSRVKHLTKLRVALGDLNDLSELANLPGIDGAGAELRPGMETMRKELLREARSLSESLFAESTDAFRKPIAAMWRSWRK
ncbi:MAG: CHAD domain-containing protein [Rhizobiales bacterium]|nr:CHAD domain-containing protein [Hyphomicrobiales bacterium]